MAKRHFKKNQSLFIEARGSRMDDTEIFDNLTIDTTLNVAAIKQLIFENYGLEISNNKAKFLKSGGTVVFKNLNTEKKE